MVTYFKTMVAHNYNPNRLKQEFKASIGYAARASLKK